MKFGVATFVTDNGIRPGSLGRALEDRGFDSLFLAEHSYIPASRESPYPGGGEMPWMYYRTLDPFVALSAAASTTRNLLVGTGIALLAQRDPLHTAKEVASLDLVSEGRAVFGVGAGWNREEMRNHGTDPSTRGALLNEQLAAVTRLWTEEEAEFHGKFVDFERVHARPKPVQRPHPPIYIGGESAAALRRLDEHGNGWLPRPDIAPEEIARVRASFSAQGRELPVTIFGAGTDEELLARWAEAGVDRVAFLLRTRQEGETLTELDGLAEIAARFR
ncbi:LLM class F420-dependent oxidoreductase [Haloechinothrix sp. YIM 98757]|uniref:LLM class F420-dependent oxidoreductase n=1 Tax=Haloechinothrix aidingensis TaxID=2752311 RepID=A0A838A198_9PSEU|nr:LLM class F420-dependent oxidoreductase [Haloechinothrix aidingensis]MBA0124903.1 LLM class F420-dependent oxidoreductase [Haloechinothrix aidingensis]